jgi:hypothetical protein
MVPFVENHAFELVALPLLPDGIARTPTRSMATANVVMLSGWKSNITRAVRAQIGDVAIARRLPRETAADLSKFELLCTLCRRGPGGRPPIVFLRPPGHGEGRVRLLVLSTGVDGGLGRASGSLDRAGRGWSTPTASS